MNPVTAAGKSLFGRLWAVSEYSQASMVIATVDRDIVAIEAEARATVLADAIQRVEGLPKHYGPAVMNSLFSDEAWVSRASVLSILRDLGDGAGS